MGALIKSIDSMPELQKFYGEAFYEKLSRGLGELQSW